VFKALTSEGGLQAPTVGTWWPELRRGAPVRPGDLLGVIEQAGLRVAVQAPKGAEGVAAQLAAAGAWVEYGSHLLQLAAGLTDLSGASGNATEQDSALPPGVRVIAANTDGTVYLRPEPGAPPYVVEGQVVAERATVALIEVMKTFSPVRAPFSGVVVRVLVDEAESVTDGQALVWIGPNA